MIPTIDNILKDLMRGAMTYAQALAYIEQHLAAAREANEDMRDVFAGLAMQALIQSLTVEPGEPPLASGVGVMAYQYADAMLVARNG